MLTQYIDAAMERATYEILKDDNSYYGEIPDCPGVYANSDTLEKCRKELKEVLEEWVMFRIYKNLPIPKIGGFEIEIKKETAV